MNQKERIWYIVGKNNKQEGPFSTIDVAKKAQRSEVSNATSCWREGMEGWKPLKAIEPFKSVIEKSEQEKFKPVWYVPGGHEKTLGPFSAKDIFKRIRSGHVPGISLCWREGMETWKPLMDVEPFKSAMNALKQAINIIRFDCTCGNEMAVAEKYAGHKVKCNRCKRILVIPPSSQSQEAKESHVEDSRTYHPQIQPLDSPREDQNMTEPNDSEESNRQRLLRFAIASALALIVLMVVWEFFPGGYPVSVVKARWLTRLGAHQAAVKTLCSYIDRGTQKELKDAERLHGKYAQGDYTGIPKNRVHPEAYYLLGEMYLLERVNPQSVTLKSMEEISEAKSLEEIKAITERSMKEAMKGSYVPHSYAEAFQEAVKRDASYKDKVISLLTKSIDRLMTDKALQNSKQKIRINFMISALSNYDHSRAVDYLERISGPQTVVEHEPPQLHQTSAAASSKQAVQGTSPKTINPNAPRDSSRNTRSPEPSRPSHEENMPSVDINVATQTGLIAWYPLNGDAQDASGHGHNGRVVGATSVSSSLGGALQFDGARDYVDCGNDSDLAPEIMTLAFWLLTENKNSNKYIVCKATDTGYNRDYSVCQNHGGKLEFFFGDNAQSHLILYSNATLSDNTWIHVAVTRDGSTAAIYVNSRLDNTAQYRFKPTNKRQPLKFGYLGRSSAGGRSFKGRIDEVRIYNRALGHQEIQQLASHTFIDEPPTQKVPETVVSTDPRNRDIVYKPKPPVQPADVSPAEIAKVLRQALLQNSCQPLLQVFDVDDQSNFTASFRRVMHRVKHMDLKVEQGRIILKENKLNNIRLTMTIGEEEYDFIIQPQTTIRGDKKNPSHIIGPAPHLYSLRLRESFTGLGVCYHPNLRWRVKTESHGDGLLLYDTKIDEITILTQDGGKNPVMSPDGQYISYSSSSGTLRIIDLEGNRIDLNISSPGRIDPSIQWSKDGRKILVSYNQVLAVIDLPNKELIVPRKPASLKERPLGMRKIRPRPIDGRNCFIPSNTYWLSYPYQNMFYSYQDATIVDCQHFNAIMFLENESQSNHSAWFHGSYENGLSAISSNGDNVIKISLPKGFRASGCAFSPSGEYLVYQREAPAPKGTYVVSLTGSLHCRLTSTPCTLVEWSPDGKYVGFYGYYYSLENGEVCFTNEKESQLARLNLGMRGMTNLLLSKPEGWILQMGGIGYSDVQLTELVPNGLAVRYQKDKIIVSEHEPFVPENRIMPEDSKVESSKPETVRYHLNVEKIPLRIQKLKSQMDGPAKDTFKVPDKNWFHEK